MRHRLSVVLALLALLSLGACASGPKFTEMQSSIPSLAADQGRIYFYRSMVLGFAVQPSVKLNDEIVGAAVPDGFFFVDRPPGDYIVSTATEVERTLSLALAAGQTRYVRLIITMGVMVGRVRPELVDNDVGAQEISKLSFSGGPPKPTPPTMGPGVPGRLPETQK